MTQVVYVAIQEGVYRHNIIGVFKDLDDAEQASVKAILGEQDRYHHVSVVECVLGDGIGFWDSYRCKGDEDKEVCVFAWNPDKGAVAMLALDDLDKWRTNGVWP